MIFNLSTDYTVMAQTIIDLEARLVSVRNAIDAALSGKTYRIKDGNTERYLERQSLADLQKLESDIEFQIKRLNGGGVRYGVYLG